MLPAEHLGQSMFGATNPRSDLEIHPSIQHSVSSLEASRNPPVLSMEPFPFCSSASGLQRWAAPERDVLVLVLSLDGKMSFSWPDVG